MSRKTRTKDSSIPIEIEKEDVKLTESTETDILSTRSPSKTRSTKSAEPSTSNPKPTKPKATKPKSPVKKSSGPRTPSKEARKIEENTPGKSAIVADSKLASPSRNLGSAVALDLSFDDTKSSPNRGFPKSKIVIHPNVKKIYKMVNKCTGTIGGNGNTGAIYGELTIGSMQKIIDMLVDKCEMNHRSRFIDVGAGLGKPNFHAAQDPAVRISIGIELETIRWQLSMFNLDYILHQIIGSHSEVNGNVNFIVSDVDGSASTDPFTHIYMYDLGFPPPLQQSIARKFNNSVHAKYLVSYRPPHRVINEYMYEVELVDRLPTAMHGSGEVHTAYFYKRTNTPRSITSRDNILRVPARKGYDEVDVDVVCDLLYRPAIEHVLNGVKDLYAHVHSISSEHLQSSRPVRERKQKAL